MSRGAGSARVHHTIENDCHEEVDHHKHHENDEGHEVWGGQRTSHRVRGGLQNTHLVCVAPNALQWLTYPHIVHHTVPVFASRHS